MDSVVSSQDTPGIGWQRLKEAYGQQVWINPETAVFAARVPPANTWRRSSSYSTLERLLATAILNKRTEVIVVDRYNGPRRTTVSGYDAKRKAFIDEHNSAFEARLYRLDEAKLLALTEAHLQLREAENRYNDLVRSLDQLKPEDLRAETEEATSAEG